MIQVPCAQHTKRKGYSSYFTQPTILQSELDANLSYSSLKIQTCIRLFGQLLDTSLKTDSTQAPYFCQVKIRAVRKFE